MKYTLIHEISHVLGFSEYYFDKFDFIYSENKNVDVVNYLNSPKVIEKVEKAKLHFNLFNINKNFFHSLLKNNNQLYK